MSRGYCSQVAVFTKKFEFDQKQPKTEIRQE